MGFKIVSKGKIPTTLNKILDNRYFIVGCNIHRMYRICLLSDDNHIASSFYPFLIASNIFPPVDGSNIYHQ